MDWNLSAPRAIVVPPNKGLTMRQLLVFSAILTGFAPIPVYGQAVSGGQASQAGGTEVRTNPYNNTNVGDQYLQQKQINNLPGQTAANVSAANLGAARPAKLAELAAGAAVNDKTGVFIARIDKVDADGVILSAGAAKVKI